jgi:hypothetical protein
MASNQTSPKSGSQETLPSFFFFTLLIELKITAFYWALSQIYIM